MEKELVVSRIEDKNVSFLYLTELVCKRYSKYWSESSYKPRTYGKKLGYNFENSPNYLPKNVKKAL